MDIHNLGEFVEYCKAHKWDANIAEHMALAERIADLSVGMERQYGGHGQPMTEWIEDAYGRVSKDSEITESALRTTHEVLSRFWVHGEAFDTWFKSKVVIVRG